MTRQPAVKRVQLASLPTSPSTYLTTALYKIRVALCSHAVMTTPAPKVVQKPSMYPTQDVLKERLET